MTNALASQRGDTDPTLYKTTLLISFDGEAEPEVTVLNAVIQVIESVQFNLDAKTKTRVVEYIHSKYSGDQS